MQIGLSTLYDIGSNYTIRLNDKEMLVVEEDPLRKREDKSPQAQIEKLQKEKEQRSASSVDELSEDEKKLVKDLAARDAEVKAHESAHQGAGGGMTGAASFSYQQGPDGKMYAIGGEVSITTPAASTPEEAIRNARQVIASAMAAGEPSSQDFAVAASARVMEMKAQQQKAKEDLEKVQGQDTYKNNLNDINEKKEDDNTIRLDIPA
ncbi:hypothetical protein GJV85_04250 [Sulfurimonas aquatica]|uniref:SprA-related family protein n=1 Tax=Sulfurimonas aquatica TaxID=2672570 RepID=A0A975GCJ7_9BACT|nr:putative metalloprotease CJM1_0395 family protein [Sulfurimonas aquatica]QSZ41349.1 hypothetical protein GJV85_04250 [Sulfurimonas aquatica]